MFGKKTIIPIPADDVGNPDHGRPDPQVHRVLINSNKPDYGRTAELLYERGLVPIPLRPRSDKPAVGWKRWTKELSVESILQYWRKYPNHGLGYIKEECNRP